MKEWLYLKPKWWHWRYRGGRMVTERSEYSDSYDIRVMVGALGSDAVLKKERLSAMNGDFEPDFSAALNGGQKTNLWVRYRFTVYFKTPEALLQFKLMI